MASIAETGVLLDAHGTPVAPAIAWHDSRGGEQAERMAAELGSARFAERTGLAPRPLCALAKYRWLRECHEPAERGVRWLSVGDWIVHRLGGEQVAELSLASRTGWLDIHARALVGRGARMVRRARRPAPRSGARDRPGRHRG